MNSYEKLYAWMLNSLLEDASHGPKEELELIKENLNDQEYLEEIYDWCLVCDIDYKVFLRELVTRIYTRR